jgi:TPR repeat protein
MHRIARALRAGGLLIAAATLSLLCASPVLAQEYSTAVADQYVKAGDWNRLLAYTQQWTRAEPQSPMAWFYLGNTILNGLNRPADSIAPLRQTTVLKPDWAEAWFFRGKAEMLAGHYADAGTSLETAIDLFPDNTNYYLTLVDLYERGIKANQPDAAAPVLAYLVKIAQAGNPQAQSMLGNIYHDGRGVPPNDTTAMQWYAKSAAQGHAYAEYALGNGYMLGIGGLPEDQAKATALFVSAAGKGLTDAQEAAAMSYELGRGTARDRRRAIYWLDQAAAQGDIYSGGFAKILRNPNTPTFDSFGAAEGFVASVFAYCWRDRFPVRRPDLDGPGYRVWERMAPNWRDSYCF